MSAFGVCGFVNNHGEILEIVAATGRFTFAFYSPISDTIFCMTRWCTVCVVAADGRRHSVDIQADSTYDAAHIYVARAKTEAAATLFPRLPIPKLSTTFEVVLDGKIYHIRGIDLEEWIQNRRAECKGPQGLLFRQRPTLVTPERKPN
jgi:hypothetical protein